MTGRQATPVPAITVGPGIRPGSRVFLRPEALQLRRPGDGGAVPFPAPDAERALDTLAAFGYEVVLLPPGTTAIELAPRDWLLTDDVEDCRWARRAGARTILVGTDATGHASQPDRCDLAAGSVYGAAIEVVVAESER